MSNTVVVINNLVATPQTRWEPDHGDIFKVPTMDNESVDLVMLTDGDGAMIYLTGSEQGQAIDREDLEGYLIESNLVSEMDIMIR